jgi:8-oxo-dGTP pyrophosphatase MutT (NUDIX family)
MKDRKKSKAVMPSDEQSSSTTTSARDIQQAGAICYRRNGRGQLRILLVGSRRNGRWGVPKGHLDHGETTAQAARRESFEEAGVIGCIETTIFGSFSYRKESSPHHYHVSVHLLHVSEAKIEFPEKNTRRQKWFPLKVAIRDVAQPGLKSLLSRLEDLDI